jgi:hypothetical protein
MPERQTRSGHLAVVPGRQRRNAFGDCRNTTERIREECGPCRYQAEPPGLAGLPSSLGRSATAEHDRIRWTI